LLQKLEIRNYILIDELSIEFNDGLSIITGETGSGKSILLGAINQLLGNRIDHKIVGPKKDKCTIEAIFNISDYGLLWISFIKGVLVGLLIYHFIIL